MNIILSKIRKILVFMLFLMFFIGCDEDDNLETDPVQQNDNTNDDTLQTFEEGKAEYERLKSVLATLGLTRTDGFPTSGIVTYKGIHGGEFFDRKTTNDLKLEYYADVIFTLDYEAMTFEGELSNFRTSVEGFENPEGVLEVNGSIRGTDDLGNDEFGIRFRVQAGNLTQNDRTASFDSFTESKGRFNGDTAEFVSVRITSLFTWTAGPELETTSETIGFMFAERLE